MDLHVRTNAREEGGIQVDGNGIQVGKEWNARGERETASGL